MVLLGGPLGISLAPFIKRSPTLYKWLLPVANRFVEAAGHRKVGMKYDDLLIEERPDVQKALSRLPEREAYDRAFRLRTGIQCSVIHRNLPKDQWIKPEDDVRYLKPYVQEVYAEDQERAAWDAVQVSKK